MWDREAVGDDQSGRLEVYDGDHIVHAADGYKFKIADAGFDPRFTGYNPGIAITPSGYPSMIIYHWSGGAHCCYDFHILELGPEFRVLDVIEALDSVIGFEDLDGDAIPEISLSDFSMAYAFTAFVGTPTPEVILRYQDGEGYRVAADLMQAKPLPTAQELQEKADLVWNECIEEQDDGTVVLKSPGDWGYGTTLWETMLDLVYAGQEDLALELFDMAWPEFAEGKEEALEKFRETVADSEWYQQLAEQLDMGKVVTEPL